jgi:hypothetical protein
VDPCGKHAAFGVQRMASSSVGLACGAIFKSPKRYTLFLRSVFAFV